MLSMKSSLLALMLLSSVKMKPYREIRRGKSIIVLEQQIVEVVVFVSDINMIYFIVNVSYASI